MSEEFNVEKAINEYAGMVANGFNGVDKKISEVQHTFEDSL